MWFLYVALIWSFGSSYSEDFECHDDPGYQLDEGPLADVIFTWFGTLQYIHIKNGTPHYFRVPRVVLISRQFVLCTAKDAVEVPKGYALGNIAFGEYERDEEECPETEDMMLRGRQCSVASLLMPLQDVVVHPEYNTRMVSDSIALLKLLTPVKSDYMLPVCLPNKNHLVSRNRKPHRGNYIYIDFLSDVPRDFIREEIEVSKIAALPKELCYLYDFFKNITKKIPSQKVMCTTGCGFHSGAPSLIHEITGHWTIVAISQGGAPCPDPLREERPPAPPRHTLLYPYVSWIMATVQPSRSFAKDDPFGFPKLRQSSKKLQQWVGRWWLGGTRCFDRGAAADDMFKFYHETFQINPRDMTSLTYDLELYAAHGALIVCVKVGMPFRNRTPKIWNIGTSFVKLRIPVLEFSETYNFQIEAFAQNFSSTRRAGSSSSSEESNELDVLL